MIAAEMINRDHTNLFNHIMSLKCILKSKSWQILGLGRKHRYIGPADKIGELYPPDKVFYPSP